MSTAQDAYVGARTEAQQWHLHKVPSLIHAYATAILAQRGWEEPARPDITSGYRSPEEQRRLIERWDSGARAGLRARPAERSWHMGGLAWDVETEVDAFHIYEDLVIALAEANSLPLKVGSRWGDPGHYAVPMGERPPSVSA